jgi:hypothetical protein
MTSFELPSSARSAVAGRSISKTRHDIDWGLLLAALQASATAIWARDLVPTLELVCATILEFLLTGYFAFCLLQWQRRLVLARLLVVPLLLLPPVIGMAKYHFMTEPAGFGDLFQLSNLVRHYGLYGWVGAVCAAALFGSMAILYLRNLRWPAVNGLVLSLPALGFWGFIVMKLLLPPAVAVELPSMPPQRLDMVAFPTPALFGNWGAFLRSAVIYADRTGTIARLRQSAEADFGFIGGTLENPDRRNVYFIVLESFMDPTAIAGTIYSKDPFSPLFQQWRTTSPLTAMSPVFGGRSADAEFEAYCGLPVTFEGAPVVFPQLQPAEIDCLPRKLARLGWQTETLTIADPHVYNYGATYPKLGFQAIHLKDAVITDDLDSLGMPAAHEVLATHLRHVDRLLASGKPFLAAVFGTYGHFPYPLDKTKRPHVISDNSGSSNVTAYANTVHYTSTAVADYVAALRARDPNALIVAFGDHHPILLETRAPVDYPGVKMARQDTPLLIIDGPRGFVPLQGRVPLYSLPDIVSNILTQGRYCQTNRCRFMESRVERPLPDALLASSRKTGRIVNCFDAGVATDALCDGADDQAKRYQAALATLLGND